MNIFLSILQVLLALWTIIGSIYMIGNYADIASTWAYETLPAAFWTGFGLLQILIAIGLLVSVKEGAWRKFATPSALLLSFVFLLGIFLYSSYTGFLGMLWAIAPAVLLGFVAYKRSQ